MSSLKEKYKQVTDKLNLTKQHLKALEDAHESLKAQVVKECLGVGIGDIITDKDDKPIQVTSVRVIGNLYSGSKVNVCFRGYKVKKDGTVGKNYGYIYSGLTMKKIG